MSIVCKNAWIVFLLTISVTIVCAIIIEKTIVNINKIAEVSI